VVIGGGVASVATADQLRDESLPLKQLVPSAATAT
jgi:hypothetical protein